MTRLVSVRYLVPVYCTVDLDATPESGDSYHDDAITRVFVADESIFRCDDPDALQAHATGDCITDAVEADDEDQANPDTLSIDEKRKAVQIAEHTVWPSWERG